jgi:hypothetical protein
MAGLPGTGLGGVFYVFLWLWILAREVLLTLNRTRRNGTDRWPEIARLGGLAGAIVGALYLEGAALKNMLGKLSEFALASGRGEETAHLAISALVPALAMSPFAMLMMILLGVRLLGFLLPLDEERGDIDALGPAGAE